MEHLGSRQWDHLQSMKRDGWFGSEHPVYLLLHLPSFPSLLPFTYVVTKSWRYLQQPQSTAKASGIASSRESVGWQWHPAFSLQHSHRADPWTFVPETLWPKSTTAVSLKLPQGTGVQVASELINLSMKWEIGWWGFGLQATAAQSISANPKPYLHSEWHILYHASAAGAEAHAAQVTVPLQLYLPLGMERVVGSQFRETAQKTFITAYSMLFDGAGPAPKALSSFNTGIPFWGAKAPRRPLICWWLAVVYLHSSILTGKKKNTFCSKGTRFGPKQHLLLSLLGTQPSRHFWSS